MLCQDRAASSGAQGFLAIEVKSREILLHDAACSRWPCVAGVLDRLSSREGEPLEDAGGRHSVDCHRDLPERWHWAARSSASATARR